MENKILSKGIVKKNRIIKIKSYEPRVTTTESRCDTRQKGSLIQNGGQNHRKHYTMYSSNSIFLFDVSAN